MIWGIAQIPQSIWPVSSPRFEESTSKILVESVTSRSTCYVICEGSDQSHSDCQCGCRQNPTISFFLAYYCAKISKFGAISIEKVHIPGVQSAGWLDIHFTVGISCERAAPLAEKNVAARHHVMRNLISLHKEHRVYWTRKMPPRGTTYWEVW
jgi:hypothetical protein